MQHMVSGQLSRYDIAKKSQQNCLFIKTVLETNKSLSDILKYKFVDYYQVSDNNENIKYIHLLLLHFYKFIKYFFLIISKNLK